MIIFLLEIVLMFVAPIAHIVLCILRVAGRVRISLVMITLICLLAGILLPILASYIDIINLPSDVKCATGSVGFAMLGVFATLAFIPVSAIIFFIIAYYRHKKINVTA